jgi:hypothetical protein
MLPQCRTLLLWMHDFFFTINTKWNTSWHFHHHLKCPFILILIVVQEFAGPQLSVEQCTIQSIIKNVGTNTGGEHFRPTFNLMSCYADVLGSKYSKVVHRYEHESNGQPNWFGPVRQCWRIDTTVSLSLYAWSRIWDTSLDVYIGLK